MKSKPRLGGDIQWHGNTWCTAFKGSRRIGTGKLADVARRAKIALDRHDAPEPVLIFDNLTSFLIEVDFRGTTDDVVSRILQMPSESEGSLASDSSEASGPAAARRPGRPKLGVVAREVTLLPRHWSWLNTQPGGASVALRKLVEQARRDNAGKDRKRIAQEATYRFMSAMAGDRPGFEEATRSLFASDRNRFEELIKSWPAGIRRHVRTLADTAI